MLLDAIWTRVVSWAYRLSMGGLITAGLLSFVRDVRFWLERKQDRLANSARLLSAYTTETQEPEKQEAA